MVKRIIAIGGGGFSQERSPLLDDYVLSLTGKPHPRVCFLPTASGDADDYVVRFYQAFHARRCEPTHLSLFARAVADLADFVLGQDVIYVGGGNTANMLAVWRVHGVDAILRKAWEVGVLICGVSAGAVCWFEATVTDSFGSELAPLRDCLGFLPGSFVPHYDAEPGRRPAFHRFVSKGLPPGVAADDGVAFAYLEGELTEVVASRPNARGYQVAPDVTGVGTVETLITPRYLGG